MHNWRWEGKELGVTRNSYRVGDELVGLQLRQIESVRDDPMRLSAALWILATIYHDKGDREQAYATLRQMDDVLFSMQDSGALWLYCAEGLLHDWNDRETAAIYLDRASQAQSGKRTGRRRDTYSIRCLQLEIAASEDPRSPDVAMLLDDVWRRANRFPVYRDSLIGALRILAPHGIGGSRAARLLHLAWRDVVYKARFGGIDRTPDEIERLMELFPEPDEYN